MIIHARSRIIMSLLFAVTMMGALLFSDSTVLAVNPLEEGALRGEGQFGKFLNKFGVTEDKPPAQPGTIIQRIVAVVFGFLGIIAVIVIIYAGFLWLTAGGEEEKAKQGRTLLFQAAIGLIIVLAAFSITYFVLYMLTISISP